MIFTFYSYKGGVGRTMALANIAELFYKNGLKVLMVDWDLEAPGLERFFQNSKANQPITPAFDKILDQPGIIDMLLAYKQQMSQPNPIDAEIYSAEHIKHYLVPIYQPSEKQSGELWLLPAGRRADAQFANYVKGVLNFDWGNFYQKWEGGRYFENLRERFLEIADVVLIDSRTGVTEMGGVCTYHLADMVIMLCAPNEQNLQGTLKMAQNFMAISTQEARGGRPLKALVVPARIERIERTGVDDVAYHAIHNQARATLTIIGPRQSGKSSLIEQLRGLSKDKEVVLLDFQELKFPDDFDAFLQQFCALLSKEVNLPEFNATIAQIWRDNPYLSAQYKCTEYLTFKVLPQLNKPLLLALDEVDILRHSPYAISFFRMLRSWHNTGQSKPTSPLSQLSLVLSIATPPHLLISNLDESPFNVSATIDVRDFTQRQALELYQRYGGTDEQVFWAVFEQLAGHPFLTQQAFYHIMRYESWSLDRLMDQTLKRQGPFAEHLEWIAKLVRQDKERLKIVQAILRQEPTPQLSDTIEYLKSHGAIVHNGHQYLIRNQLYQQYFERWLI